MKQAIAGVTPFDMDEATVMTVWPSNAAIWLGPLPLGRLLGRLYSVQGGFYIFKLSSLFCLLSIPLALVLYLKRVGPFVATRYRLTNRRVIVEAGLKCKESKSIGLDRFDSVDVELLPGQQWYDAGDLVFRRGDVETFRLEGVSRPHAFRETCIKAQKSFVGVKQALEFEAAT